MTRDQLLRRYGAVDHLSRYESAQDVAAEQGEVAMDLLRAIAKGLVADPQGLAGTLLHLLGEPVRADISNGQLPELPTAEWPAAPGEAS